MASSSLPATMRAIGITATGGPDVLRDVEVPLPTLRPRDVLVRVLAVSVNPVDTKKRLGGMGTAPSEATPVILGYDAVGDVVSVGEEVTDTVVGERVWYAGDVTRAGTNAQFHAVDERIISRAPTSISPDAAAALPLVLLTAWEALAESLAIPMDPLRNGTKTLLIVNGAGGVGSVASQLAKRVWGFANVVSTASRAESVAFCKAHGADATIDHSRPYRPQLEALGLPGVDYALACVDLDTCYDELVDVLVPMGRMCAITLHDSGKIAVGKMFAKRLTLVFELMFTRSMFATPDIAVQRDILTRGAGLVDTGKLVSTVTSTVPLSAATLREAHEKQQAGRMLGKQVLTAAW